MSTNRQAGVFFVKINGEVVSAKGEFTFGGDNSKREGMVDESGTVVGYKETPQLPFIEGAIFDLSSTDSDAIKALDGCTVSVQLANGKTKALSDAWYAHDGNQSTGEGTLPVRFEGKHLDTI
ncbi:MAG: phage tail tube protein [Proteobacteria bacterium]|nr:phage tail tube protein [Pseudomonadota bacterium]